MIGVGYMAKRVVERPDWLAAPQVSDIYSASNCISPAFMDYTAQWRHNGYGFFDDPQIIMDLAREADVGLSDLTLFYYEAYPMEFDDELTQWLAFEPQALPTRVVGAPAATLHGYDVVTFSMGAGPECSPLSCNRLASTIPTNRHCLLNSLDQATASLAQGLFEASEPGPFRILAVHTAVVPSWPA